VPAYAFLAIGLLIGGAIAALLIYDRHLLRNRIFLLLRWIDASLIGNGHITGVRWLSAHEVDVPVRLRSSLFRHSRFHVRLARHPLLECFLNRFRSCPQVAVSFRTNLDSMPNFAIEMQTMRWFARSRKKLNTASAGWSFQTAEPLVLTTKLDWQREITSAFQALLASNRREGVTLTFQRHTPHFSATFQMEESELDSEPCNQLLQVLVSVAEGASQRAS
jgi:hypothetical protein